MAGFNVNIGANTIQLSRNLAELKKELSNFKKELSTATDAQQVIRLNQAIAQTERQIKAISSAQSIKAIGRDMKELPAGFNQATFAVGNFSRVVQDAPFSLLTGNLMAVSNNIDPLIQSFIQLKQQSGSSGAAFKALASSLVGSGGLMLGLSLVNAALTYFSARSMYAKEKTDELGKSIKTVSQIENEAVGGVQGTIAQVQNLAAVVLSANKSYKERTRALQELKEVNKNYFGDMTLEANKLDQLKEKVEKYTEALINEAIVKKYSDAIGDLGIKIDDQKDALERAETATKGARNELEKQKQAVLDLAKAGVQGEEFRKAKLKEYDIQQKVTDATEKQREEGDKLTKLEEQQIIQKNKMNAAQQAGLKLQDLTAGSHNKETDALKKRIEALKSLKEELGLNDKQIVELRELEIKLLKRDGVAKLGFTPEEVRELIQKKLDEQFTGEFVDARLQVRVRGEFKRSELKLDLPKETSIDVSSALGLENIDLSSWDELIKKMKGVSEAKKELTDDAKEKALAGFITEQLGPAFTDLFANIATDGSNAMEEFGRSVAGIVKRLIAAAAAAAVLSAILSAIFPGAAKSGGLSFGSLFGSLTGFKFAQGGIVTGPTLGLIGEMNRPEAILPLDRLPQILGQINANNGGSDRLTAHVSGDGLLFVLDRTARKQGRIL